MQGDIVDSDRYTEDTDFGDWADEWGNVTCQNCGTVNDLSNGARVITCWNCEKHIDTRTGKVVEEGGAS